MRWRSPRNGGSSSRRAPAAPPPCRPSRSERDPQSRLSTPSPRPSPAASRSRRRCQRRRRRRIITGAGPAPRPPSRSSTLAACCDFRSSRSGVVPAPASRSRRRYHRGRHPGSSPPAAPTRSPSARSTAAPAPACASTRSPRPTGVVACTSPRAMSPATGWPTSSSAPAGSARRSSRSSTAGPARSSGNPSPTRQGFTGGIYVAAADVTGDGIADIITQRGPGGGPHVLVTDGATGEPIAGPLAGFMAYDPAFAGGSVSRPAI